MTSDADQLLSSYDFALPREAIAQQPVEPRHSARLLLVEPGEGARHRTVWDWSEELRPGDLIVVNDTRVLQARLRARRASGGVVEVLVLQPWAAAGGAARVESTEEHAGERAGREGAGREHSADQAAGVDGFGEGVRDQESQGDGCGEEPGDGGEDPEVAGVGLGDSELEPDGGRDREVEGAGWREPEVSQDEGSDWLCLLKPAKRLKIGESLSLETPAGTPCDPPVHLTVVASDPASGGRVVRFPPGLGDAGSIEPFLQRHGTMPLPPYIHDGGGVAGERYQTRYAARPGAVAAPTAGLHLSDALLERLRERGVERATVTLHVGLGTFRPLDQERLEGLELHSEWVEVSEALVAAVAAARARGGRVVAVGTTCVRSLEGVAALHGGRLRPHAGPINLVIQPGHRFQVVQGLLTNFHLPRSSLLLLVSALIGRERLLALYGEAIREGYRFFSFGDAMWIPPEAVVVAGGKGFTLSP